MSNDTLQRPSVGRIVHFLHASGEGPTGCQAAIVTAVWSDTMVNLAVFSANGGASNPSSVGLGDELRTWHWPEYVQPFAAFDPK